MSQTPPDSFPDDAEPSARSTSAPESPRASDNPLGAPCSALSGNPADNSIGASPDSPADNRSCNPSGAPANPLQARVEKLECRLARQDQLLKTLLDGTPDLISLQDERLVYRTVNRAFRAYFSVREEDVVGRTDFDIFSRAQAERNRQEDLAILESGRPLDKQLLVEREGVRRWFHIVKTPVRDKAGDGGRVVGLLLTARDVTVIKQYQEQLIQSQKMEDLGKLAGGVAHEINTPLGVILGYAQLLLEDAEPESQTARDLAVIERQAKVCRRIVADLLKFSRHIDSAMAPLDVNRSISEVVSLVGPIFSQDRVRIETRLDDSIPLIVGDLDKLRQVWINLLNNAFDAIGQDGRIIVRSKLCKNRRRVVVTLADTGSGVPPEVMTKIFDPFFSTKPVGKGTGLGLSVTLGIIQDHGGKVSAISPAPMEYLEAEDETWNRPPGPGTVFFVELPLAGERLPDEECPETREAREQADARTRGSAG